MKKINLLVFGILCTMMTLGQDWNTAGNTVGGGAVLGTNNNQPLLVRTNGTARAKLMQNGNITVNTFTYNAAGFFGLSQDPTFFNTGLGSPFSLLHLNGDNPNGGPEQLGFRDWMRYGITFTHNQDMMYIGPRRIGDDVTDAVIVWGDNSINSQNGPDNLTFNWSTGTGPGVTEVARMTAEGHTGIGTLFNNNEQPSRALEVWDDSDDAQVQISYSPTLFTELQTSDQGDYHVLPSNFMALGFDPATDAPSEMLDINGTARLRDTPSETPDALITGVEENGIGDYTLNHLEFPGNNNEFLAGDATWVDVGDLCE